LNVVARQRRKDKKGENGPKSKSLEDGDIYTPSLRSPKAGIVPIEGKIKKSS
jgi:hypothetical protein